MDAKRLEIAARALARKSAEDIAGRRIDESTLHPGDSGLYCIQFVEANWRLYLDRAREQEALRDVLGDALADAN